MRALLALWAGPRTSAAALAWAAGLFHSFFTADVAALLIEHPAEEIDPETGRSFWGGGARRLPDASVGSVLRAEDEAAGGFAIAAATLLLRDNNF